MARSVLLLLAFIGVAWLGSDRETREQIRLRSHFDSVLIELRSRDVSDLTARQRASRDDLIAWLGDYRAGGRFPRNDRFSATATPIFRDARGVTCAMAYLIGRSGRRDMVDRIAFARNLAYIHDLASDTILVAWLDSTGLGVEEAARIQPAYPGQEQEANPLVLGGVTLVMSGLSIATAASNITKPREPMGFIGMAVGGLTLLAATVMSHDHVALTALNVGSGSVAVLAGAYAAFRPRTTAPPRGGRKSARDQIDLVPIVQWAPNFRRTRYGVAVRF